MRTATHVIQFVLAAFVVVALGGLAGWYFYVHKTIQTTEQSDAARGFGDVPSFGRGLGSTYENIGGGQTGSEEPGRAAPRLWQVSKNPAAGAGFMASTSAVFFAERATGNILAADPQTSAVVRLTNTVFAKIYEALFAPDGSVLLRSQSGTGAITTFAGTLASSTPSLSATTTGTLSGLYLAENIRAAAVKPPRQIVFLLSEDTGGVTAATADWNGGKQKVLFRSGLSNWRISVLADGQMLLMQSPSDDVPGSAFIAGADGALTPLVSNKPGLTVITNGKGALLYGTSAQGKLTLYAQAGANASAVALPIQTTAEKCVWARGNALIAYCAVPQTAPGKEFLRNWYRGAVHTADSWYTVDVSAGTASPLFSPEASLVLDVQDPMIDASGAYIAFLNAADRTLWMLRIAQ